MDLTIKLKANDSGLSHAPVASFSLPVLKSEDKTILVEIDGCKAWLPKHRFNNRLHDLTASFASREHALELLRSLDSTDALHGVHVTGAGKTERGAKVQFRLMVGDRETRRTAIVPAGQIVSAEGATFVPGWVLASKLKAGESLLPGWHAGLDALIKRIEGAYVALEAEVALLKAKANDKRLAEQQEREALEEIRDRLLCVAPAALAYCKRKSNLDGAIAAGVVDSRQWPSVDEGAYGLLAPLPDRFLPGQAENTILNRRSIYGRAQRLVDWAVSMGFDAEKAKRKLAVV